MTAQLSRERIEQYANDPRMCNVNEEIRTMARMLLAGLDSKPVAYFYPGDETEWQGVALAEELDDEQKARCIPLYAAPPAPVAVPDDVSGPLAHAYKELKPQFMRHFVDIFERYGIAPTDSSTVIQAIRIALDGIERCADMLKAWPVTGWIKCSERMPGTVGLYRCCVDEDKTSGKRNCVINCLWDGNGWDEPALLALGGTVTHWMPLPAAPEQEG